MIRKMITTMKIITTMIRPKLEYAKLSWSLLKIKHVEIGRIQRITTMIMLYLEDITYEKIRRQKK